MNRRKKVLVIGLDCAPPELVFDKWLDELPNFKRVMDDGCGGSWKAVSLPLPFPRGVR